MCKDACIVRAGKRDVAKNEPLLTSFNYGCRESADDSIIHSSIQPGVQAAALSCCCSARPSATLAAKLNWPFPLSPLCFAWKPLKCQEWAFFLILSDALTEHPVLFWSFFFLPQWLRPLHGQRSEFFCRPSDCVSLLPLHRVTFPRPLPGFSDLLFKTMFHITWFC